jgi:transcriptional regulator with XRE-family HTH domain
MSAPPTESPMKRFAQQVRERRTLAKLTLAELAERSGVTKASIS